MLASEYVAEKEIYCVLGRKIPGKKKTKPWNRLEKLADAKVIFFKTPVSNIHASLSMAFGERRGLRSGKNGPTSTNCLISCQLFGGHRA